jgi:hypothetical protein
MEKCIPQTAMAVFCAALLLFAGCGKEEKPAPPPGPAERLGREIDNAMHKAIDQAKEVQKKLGEKAEQAGKELQKTEKADRDE